MNPTVEEMLNELTEAFREYPIDETLESQFIPYMDAVQLEYYDGEWQCRAGVYTPRGDYQETISYVGRYYTWQGAVEGCYLAWKRSG